MSFINIGHNGDVNSIAFIHEIITEMSQYGKVMVIDHSGHIAQYFGAKNARHATRKFEGVKMHNVDERITFVYNFLESTKESTVARFISNAMKMDTRVINVTLGVEDAEKYRIYGGRSIYIPSVSANYMSALSDKMWNIIISDGNIRFSVSHSEKRECKAFYVPLNASSPNFYLLCDYLNTPGDMNDLLDEAHKEQNDESERDNIKGKVRPKLSLVLGVIFTLSTLFALAYLDTWVGIPLSGLAVGFMSNYFRSFPKSPVSIQGEKDEPFKSTPSATVNNDAQWDTLFERHQAIIQKWLEYEMDLSMALAYPLMIDPADPITNVLHRGVIRAGDLRDHLDKSQDVLHSDYYQAVVDLEVAYANAESNARKVGRTIWNEEERKKVKLAQDCFSIAQDENASPHERQVAYERGLVSIEGITALPVKGQRATEAAIKLITAGPMNDAPQTDG